ncbi:MAG: hypothetical protein IKI39_06160 [Oscillospiraceae bacterium]|nr:hypothetical protein [Oscillospiraceae bacterium]MBR7074676.1 hypothetical protein [Oscillospiraceae bacterium]
MGKSIRRKTATFELEPDGFSIHTFELSCQIKGKQYREIKDILDRFEELGVSPIPLWKSFCAERLPSPVTLLRGISEGEIKVDYVLIK